MSYIHWKMRERESFKTKKKQQNCWLVTKSLIEEFHSTTVCVDISVSYQASSVTQRRNSKIQAR